MAVLTLPVERKYCARAITNSWAGTSFTVRGADGMVRARQKKGRPRAEQDPKNSSSRASRRPEFYGARKSARAGKVGTEESEKRKGLEPRRRQSVTA